MAADSDPDLPCGFLGESGNLHPRNLTLAQDRLGVRMQQPPGFREMDLAIFQAHKEALPQLLLQQPNLLAYGGLRHIHLLRSRSKPACFDNCRENLKLSNCHIARAY